MSYINFSLRPTRVSRQALVILLLCGGLLFPIATRQAAQTRRPPRIVTGLTDVIYAIRFSPDSQTLAIARGARDDYRVERWDSVTGNLRYTIKGLGGRAWAESTRPG